MNGRGDGVGGCQRNLMRFPGVSREWLNIAHLKSNALSSEKQLRAIKASKLNHTDLSSAIAETLAGKVKPEEQRGHSF
jgi:hypothetical protein